MPYCMEGGQQLTPVIGLFCMGGYVECRVPMVPEEDAISSHHPHLWVCFLGRSLPIPLGHHLLVRCHHGGTVQVLFPFFGPRFVEPGGGGGGWHKGSVAGGRGGLGRWLVQPQVLQCAGALQGRYCCMQLLYFAFRHGGGFGWGPFPRGKFLRGNCWHTSNFGAGPSDAGKFNTPNPWIIVNN